MEVKTSALDKKVIALSSHINKDLLTEYNHQVIIQSSTYNNYQRAINYIVEEYHYERDIKSHLNQESAIQDFFQGIMALSELEIYFNEILNYRNYTRYFSKNKDKTLTLMAESIYQTNIKVFHKFLCDLYLEATTK